MEIRIEAITKRFGPVLANDAVSLTIRGGRVRALLGENGAGKSTLMNVLYGLIQPDAGAIIIDGQPVRFRNPADAISHRIGMIHQEFMLVPSLTVLENIILGHEPAGASGWLKMGQARSRIEGIMQTYGLEVPLDKVVSDLPVGLQQRVEILKALFRGATALILDEPTAVLTPQEAEGLFRAVRGMTAEGKTVIFITHKLREVLAVADEIAVMRDGKMVADLPNENLTEMDIARLMVGRDVLMRLEKEPRRDDQPILELSDLWVVDDRKVPRVKGVSFTVRSGEVVGIAGVAGNGQAELVEAVFGLTPLQSGTVRVKERMIKRPTPRLMRDSGVAYVPQDRNHVGCIRTQPIWKNYLAGRQWRQPYSRLGVLRIKEIRGQAQSVVELFRVKTPGIDTNCGALSGGNIQKVIVGRELTSRPALLIAEDPTRGIDIQATEFVRQQILDHARQGGAVLLVSADLQEVMMMSHRILVIYDGQIAGERDGETATEEELGLLMTGGRGHA